MYAVYSPDNGAIQGVSQSGTEPHCIPISKELGIAMMTNPAEMQGYVVTFNYVSREFELTKRQSMSNFSILRALCPYPITPEHMNVLYARIVITERAYILQSNVPDYQRKSLVCTAVLNGDPFEVVEHISLKSTMQSPSRALDVPREHLSIFGPFEFDRTSYCYEPYSR